MFKSTATAVVTVSSTCEKNVRTIETNNDLQYEFIASRIKTTHIDKKWMNGANGPHKSHRSAHTHTYTHTEIANPLGVRCSGNESFCVHYFNF